MKKNEMEFNGIQWISSSIKMQDFLWLECHLVWAQLLVPRFECCGEAGSKSIPGPVLSLSNEIVNGLTAHLRCGMGWQAGV
jgi:hypothetical protein